MYINNYDADTLIEAVAEALAYGYDADTYAVEDATCRAVDEGVIFDQLDTMLTYYDDILEVWGDMECPEPSTMADGIMASMRFAILEEVAIHEAEVAEEAALRGVELVEG